jgi:serine/threonine-protein phosphatase 2A regulatory subunit B
MLSLSIPPLLIPPLIISCALSVFEEEEDAASKSYFSEIIASVSDIEFTGDGRYIVARDYLSVKVWDLHMERAPVRVIPVHEYLRPKLSELYESDCIFDKFRVAASGGSGRQILTGSYNSCVKVYDVVKGTETMVELAKARLRPPVVRRVVGGTGIGRGAPGFAGLPSSASTAAAAAAAAASASPGAGGEEAMNGSAGFKNGGVETDAWGDGVGGGGEEPPPVNPDELDFGKKVLHYSWHPNEDIIAVAGLNNLYIYHA